MSDDVEFQLLTQVADRSRTLGVECLRLPVEARTIGCSRLSLSAGIGCAHGAHEHASLVITLAVVGVIAIEVGRLGLREFRREAQ